VRVEAGAVDELAEGVPKPVVVGSREIVLVRWRGRVFAVRNVCPHMTQSFEFGSVMGRPCGSLGEVDYREDDPILTCPWHQFEYSLTSGQCITDRNLRVRTYNVSIEDGKVFIDAGREAARAEPAGII
jgi:nitrite reductase (NADH) small subunit